jgi:ABC-type multidrug transport system permease subunit
MFLAGKRYFPAGTHVPWFSFTIALLISTWSILSIGFLIASIVPTARFAQPIGAIILYPMIAFSGLFVPIQYLPPVLQTVTRALPLTYAVRLLEGIWNGDGWCTSPGRRSSADRVCFLSFTAISANESFVGNLNDGCFTMLSGTVHMRRFRIYSASMRSACIGSMSNSSCSMKYCLSPVAARRIGA